VSAVLAPAAHGSARAPRKGLIGRLRGDRELLVAVVVCGMALLGSVPGLGSYLVLAAFAVRGARQAIVALLLSCLLTMSNPALVAAPAAGGLGRYFVLFAAAVGALRAGRAVSGLTLVSAGLGSFFLAHSVLISEMPAISLAKSVAWAVAMVGVAHAWSTLTAGEAEALISRIYVGITVCLFLSIPLYATSAGFTTNSRGFQGLLSHPQAFGSLMGVYAAWSVARALASPIARSRHLSLGAIAVVLIVLSQARTGAVAALAGVTVTLVVAAFPGRRRWTAGRQPFKWLVPATALALAGLLHFGGTVQSVSTTFVQKGTEADGLVGGYLASRGGLLDPMLANISRDPIFGIGLGVPSSLDASQVETVWGIPVGLPVEKGMVAIALLEEVGLFGAILAAIWIGVVFFRVIRARRLELLAASVAVLFVNLSEAVLFSPGGMGMFAIVMLGASAARGRREPR
jgi:hypothetical protein